MLKICDLYAYYGHIEALHGISLEVGEREIVALIGSNGAGKTTLLNAISGHVKAKGSIQYQEHDLLKLKSNRIASLGLVQVPEGRHVFPGLTVEQNLAIGTVADKGVRLKLGNIDEKLEMVYEIFPKLKERHKQLAWSLSGGEQQMMVIGRALMGAPKLLMLDEPSMGLAPKVIEEVFERIVEIHRAGTPVLLVEQNASLALRVSERAYVIEQGRITLSGKSQDLRHDPKVREAYLGKRKRQFSK